MYVVNLARQIAERTGEADKAASLAERERMLERSRLAREDTLCHDSMTEAEKRWIRQRRPEAARRWRLITDLSVEHLHYVDYKPLDPSNTQPLNEAIYQTQTLIGKLERDIAELEEKIQQRLNAYGLRLSDMENFAYQVQSTKAAWLELQKAKQEISKAFDAAVVDIKDNP